MMMYLALFLFSLLPLISAVKVGHGVPKTLFNCEGINCVANETCCADKQHGSICCIEETSFCCPSGDGLPSRCCPRWMVCCDGGQYGCCDPQDLKVKKPETGVIAYALFDEGDITDGSSLWGFKIDLSDATKTQQHIPGFNDYDEITRLFTYNPVKNLFYLLRANFSHPGFDGTEPITLTTVDPVKLTSVDTPVTGAAGLLTGFLYSYKLDTIIAATYRWSDKVKVGYNFYFVDTKTGVAKLVSQSTFPEGKDNYEGWFDEISVDGSLVYRLGYQDVPNSIGLGLGITNITQSQATTEWYNNVGVSNGLRYMSLNIFENDFISMAQDDDTNLSVVRWNLSGAAPKVLVALYDAHPPRFFGPIAEAIDYVNSKYYTLVVHNGIIPVQTDRWALATVDLKSGENSITPLYPWMLAGIDSLSGFGIPNQ